MSTGLHRDKGAHYFRCDLQVHTPRDNQWRGQSAADEASRRAYAKAFVAQCRSIDLNAVAITDHHDFAYFPYIREAAAEETRTDGAPLAAVERLVVFPGLELTLGQPTFQAILILDANFPEDRLTEVLQALSIEPVDPTVDRLPGVTSIDHIKSPLALHEELDKRPWMRGRYILLPNVTDGGHKTMMRSGMKVAYKEMPCIGGYLDGTVDKIGSGNTSIFSGKDSNYGNKRIAVFQTSDSRSATFADLGKHSTWVKWTAPTAEALRQACLAEESRIAQTEPQLPNVAISSIDVSNSLFLGPLNVAFNQQCNAIIGGRGTGKSTILSYLRWALCDQPIDSSVDDEAETGSIGARQKRLIESTLAPVAAQVEVHFLINGLPHVVRRHADTGEIFLKVGLDEYRQVREDDIRVLLPVHAYSQKQLSSVSVRVDELTRFITTPIQSKLEEIDRRIAEAEGRLRENYATLQRVRVLDQGVDRANLEIRSLEDQAASIRESLGNLTDDERALLGAKPFYDTAADIQRSAMARLEEADSSLTATVAALDGLGAASQAMPDQSTPELEQPIEEVLSGVSTIVRNLARHVRAAQAELLGALADDSSLVASNARLAAIQAEFDAKYQAVKQKSFAHEEKLAELAEVERRASEAKVLRDQQSRKRSVLNDPEAMHHEYRSKLGDLARERSEMVEGQCRVLDDLSDGLIHAELQIGVGLGAAAERFRTGVAGASIRSTKIESLFEQLQAEDDPLESWNKVLDELELIIHLDPDTNVRSSDTPTMSRLGFLVPDQERARTRLTADGWLDLALTPVQDQPCFEYQVKESDYIAFSDASAGQQATALLRVLLAQAGPPLIIDQPEDDLDSQVVLDVVRWIWSAKSRRQLIFASHNANLVVNGDAELVVVCENRTQGDQSGGQVGPQGAIDVEEIRSAVTQIMEGGEKAFKLRKEKYGF